MKNKLQIFSALAVVLAVAVAAGIYLRYAAPTRVALVNYPEYMAAPLLDQELPPGVQVDALPWTEKSGPELRRYDAIIFFGMGLQLTEEQSALLQRLKVPHYVTASTRQETALDTFAPEHSVTLRNYLGEGGKENFRRMLAFIRHDVDGKRINAPEAEPPKELPRSVFFHIAEDSGRQTYEEYIQYYQEIGRYHPENPTVLLLSGNGGGDLESLIAALEAKNINVVAASAFGGVPKLVEECHADMIIYQPHGRLGMGMDPEGTLAMLQRLNIPLVCPIKVGQDYRVFLKDQQGMTGGMLSQSVTMPELDGGIIPYVLSALYPNRRGLLDFRGIPDRLERFSTMVRKMLDLKRIPNSEKKLAIVYYKAPGRNALEAGGLEVGDSLLNTLRHLQSIGYTTGPLPETAEALNAQIQENGAVFGSYAEGAQEEFLKRARVEVLSSADYAAWVKRAMPDDLYAEVVERYGEFPGKTRFADEHGNMLLPRLQFGNIVLLPQGLPGEGEDENKLVHGVKMSPPHTYLATYLWIRYGFGADALLHFGTHGSLEFTPWKQVALSSYDWPDVLIGDLPHYYLYTCNNVGEALIAKRRSYATMVTHLTAPFMLADAYGAVAELDEKLHNYETVEDPMLRAEYAKSIIELAKREHYDLDLKLSEEFTQGKLNEEDFLRLHTFIHEIGNSKVNRGVYVIGRPYSEDEATETAALMMVDTFADRQFQADVAAGKVDEAKRDDQLFYEENYTIPARTRIAEVFASPETAEVEWQTLMDEWQAQVAEAQSQPAAPAAAPPAGMGGMMGSADPEKLKTMLETGKFEDGRDIPEAMLAAMKAMGVGAAQTAAPPAGMRRGPRLPPKPEMPLGKQLLDMRRNLLDSTRAELAGLENAFNGGYLPATSGGDPIGNPSVVPTGKNMYGIDPERTPTRESYAVGQKLARSLIEAKLKSTGEYPRKVAFTLWGGEFIRTQGTNIGEIFYLLGVEPIWDSRGRVQDVRLIPGEQLGRPRIDVVVQTSGQFRGAATSRMRLIDKAVRLAAEDDASTQFANYVVEGSVAMVRALIDAGMAPETAKSYSTARIFGGLNGGFGTGSQGMVQDSASWDDTARIAELYINNMGALYTEEHWNEAVPGAFRGALANTDTVVQSTSSNTWGPLSLDHVYEFTGGISLAAKHVTGKDPDAYFNVLKQPGQAKVQAAGEAVMLEARASVLNPKYLAEMMQEGPSAAQSFSDILHNTFGWEVMKPDVVQDHLWEEYQHVFVDDSLDLGMREYFEAKNPYAYQDLIAVMLEAARKEMWHPSAEDLAKIAQLHAELVRDHEAGCSQFVCNNDKLREFLAEKLPDQDLARIYRQSIQKIREAAANPRQPEEVKGQVLKEQQVNPAEPRERNRQAIYLLGSVLALLVLLVLFGSRQRKL